MSLRARRLLVVGLAASATIAVAVPSASASLPNHPPQRADVRADTVAPAVRVTVPADRGVVSTSVTLAGTARDDRAVAAVRLVLRRSDGLWFDGSAWRARKVSFRARLADAGAARTTWSRTVPVTAGRRYVLTTVSVDAAGHRSEPVERRFRAVRPADLAVDLGAWVPFDGLVEWTVRVTNSGGPTTGVSTLNFDVYPVDNLVFDDVETGWTCETDYSGSGQVTCTAPAGFPNGGEARFTFLVTVFADLWEDPMLGTGDVSTPGETNTADNSDSELVVGDPPFDF